MSEALEIAVAVSRAPPLGVRLHAQALPGDVLDVIRIAAGDRVATAQATAATGLDVEPVREAATHYLQLALFHEHADSYRTLGLTQDASSTRLKEHYRWLMHWLHPDRDRGAELSVFSERVNRAWNDLRTPSRREAYDQFLKHRRAAAESAEAMPWGDGEIYEREVRAERMFAHWLSGRTVRRLPAIVVGTLAVLVGALVIALLTLRSPSENESQPGGVETTEHGAVPVEPPAADARTPDPAPPPSPPAASAETVRTDAAHDDTMPPEIMLAPAVTSTTASAGAEASALTAAPESSSGLAAQSAPPEGTRDVRRPSATPATAPLQPPVDARAGATAAGPVRRTTSDTETFGAPPAATPEPERSTAHAAKAEPLPRVARVPTPAQAQGTLERMQDAYRQGDLSAMMALFASDLRDPPRSEVTTQYADLFRSSSERSLVLRNVGWIVRDDTAVGLGQYETVVIAHPSATPRIASGTIRVELRMEGDEPRIVRLRHDRLSGS